MTAPTLPRPPGQRLTWPGFERTVAAALDRLGQRAALSPAERQLAERAWQRGEAAGKFARGVKRARTGSGGVRGGRRPLSGGRSGMSSLAALGARVLR